MQNGHGNNYRRVDSTDSGLGKALYVFDSKGKPCSLFPRRKLILAHANWPSEVSAVGAELTARRLARWGFPSGLGVYKSLPLTGIRGMEGVTSPGRICGLWMVSCCKEASLMDRWELRSSHEGEEITRWFVIQLPRESKKLMVDYQTNMVLDILPTKKAMFHTLSFKTEMTNHAWSIKIASLLSVL